MSAMDTNDLQARAEGAEQEVRDILNSLKRHCKDDFVIITDGAIDWSRTIDEFVSFITTPFHNQYAHEGGKPQIMTPDILKRWIAALDVPIITDIYQTNAPNVFYATFAMSLFPDDKAQIEALGIDVIYPNSPLRNRYMLKWQPPKDDES